MGFWSFFNAGLILFSVQNPLALVIAGRLSADSMIYFGGKGVWGGPTALYLENVHFGQSDSWCQTLLLVLAPLRLKAWWPRGDNVKCLAFTVKAVLDDK